MIALFAVVSVASMSAFYIEIVNQTGSLVRAFVKGTPYYVGAQKKRQTRDIKSIVKEVVVKQGLRYQKFTVPKSMRGKNITVTVNRSGKRGLAVSSKLKE